MAQLGRFKLGKEIGSDPQSTTYEAQDGAQRCAVRVINDNAVPADARRRAGLVKALQGLTGIEHPSIVRVLDAGDQDGKIFVAMELMTCPTLEQRLTEQQRLDEQQVVLFIRQTAQALDKARDLGYCHGDLTPHNVFVVSPEKVKLTAFSVKALLTDPPDMAALEAAGGAGAAGDEWVTAEDLLRTKSKKTVVDRAEDDLVALAVLMLKMLGFVVPDRSAARSLGAYRRAVMDQCYDRLTAADTGVGVHTAEVVRRLLTEGGFDNPGEVVVELASAMLLGRSVGRPRPAAGPKPPAAAETAHAQRGSAGALGAEDLGDLSALEFKGDPRKAAFTPFFIWTDRRGGRFLVIHEGERVSIGRDPDMSDWTLMDPAISRRHCFLTKEDGVLRVEDIGSSNGTFVNGERVQEAEVRPGDALRVGTTRFYMGLAEQGM
jgi:hypothetical protein